MQRKEQPNWLFKVAANAENGGGHVSRSLILAHAMNTNASFSIPLNSPYRSLIESQGFKVIAEDAEHDTYDGIWLDIYHGDFDKYRSKTNFLTVIEDHKDLYDKANVYVRPFPGNFISHLDCRELTGLDYALIDPKFFLNPVNVLSEKLQTITIFMGRYDSVNATGKILETLNALPIDANIQVVMGGAAAHLDLVETYLEKDFRHLYQLLIDLPDLADIFAQSDLLILSGGVALLEACALGRVAVVLNIADNQTLLSAHLSDIGAIAYAGHISQFNQKDFSDLLSKLFISAERQKISAKASALINSSGAYNVASVLMKASMEGVS